jgi:Putative beta barrel porin-7 (BBP7)
VFRNALLSLAALASGSTLVSAQDPRAARPAAVSPSPYAPLSAYIRPTEGAPAGAKPDAQQTGARTAAPLTSAAPVHAVPAPGACGTCDPVQRLCCEPCGPPERGWFRAEYLIWAVQGSGAPPLVAQDLPGTPRTSVGIPGTPGQQILYGGPGFNGGLRSGFRFDAGIWLDECRLWALTGDIFALASATDASRFSSVGDPPLTRPFTNSITGLPAAELVSLPGSLAGAITVNARNTFWGAGAFVTRNLCCEFDGCDPCDRHGYRVDAVFGYRHYSLTDDLRIREDLLSTNEQRVPPGTRITVNDRFRTENRFHGALVGLNGTWYCGQWSFGGRVGASIGTMYRELLIEGSTVVQVPGGMPSTRVGGLFAQTTNIGRYRSDTFTVVPELGFNLGYQLTPHITAYAGYTWIYLPNVWRAGDQIDVRVDPVQLAGGTSARNLPAPTFASTNAFVQGVNFGVRLGF